MTGGLVIACVLVSALAAEAPRGEPVVEQAEGATTVQISALPQSVLADEAIRKQLTSGLTTSLVLRARAVGGGTGRIEGGAQVTIRFEPWDEVFLVRAVGIDGRGGRATFESFSDLEAWWRDLHLTVVDDPRLLRSSARRVRVELDVVPFSEQEQRDTQRWFADVLDEAGAASEVGESTRQGNDALRQVFHLLMATSIRRHPLASFEWTVPLVRPPSTPEMRP